MYTDGASNASGAGVGIVLVNPEGSEFNYALNFTFSSTNNDTEYEALLAGLRMASKMRIKQLEVRVDSALVANQIKGDFETKEEVMLRYENRGLELWKDFKHCTIKQIPRGKNTEADAASKLASLAFPRTTGHVLVETLSKRSIEVEDVNTIVGEEEPCWMTPIFQFLRNRQIPENNKEAKKLIMKSPMYAIQDEVLYKKSFLMPWLRCVGPTQPN